MMERAEYVVDSNIQEKERMRATELHKKKKRKRKKELKMTPACMENYGSDPQASSKRK